MARTWFRSVLRGWRAGVLFPRVASSRRGRGFVPGFKRTGPWRLRRVVNHLPRINRLFSLFCAIEQTLLLPGRIPGLRYTSLGWAFSGQAMEFHGSFAFETLQMSAGSRPIEPLDLRLDHPMGPPDREIPHFNLGARQGLVPRSQCNPMTANPVPPRSRPPRKTRRVNVES